MRRAITWMVAVTAVAVTLVPHALAGYGGIEGAASRHLGRFGCIGKGICNGLCCSHNPVDCQCYTVMETRTRTVYDRVTECCEKTVYDTVYDRQTVQDVRHVSQTCYRQEQFTYERPVYETETSQVPYTICRPVCEMQTRDVNYVRYVPSYETRTRSIPYTVYQTVTETGTRTVSYCVPRLECYTKTVPVMSGHWETRTYECPAPECCLTPVCGILGRLRSGACEPGAGVCGLGHAEGACNCGQGKGADQKSEVAQKGDAKCDPPCQRTVTVCRRVWVPCVEQKEVTCHRTVYDTQTREVPYTRCRQVPETRTREVQCTVCRMVPVNETRTVQYPVVRMVSEQQFRTVCRTVSHMVTETGTRTVPYTVTHDIPVTREVCVPRQVPRTVTFTVNKCVPRTECYQVPVRVCVPIACDPKCGEGKCKGKADVDSDKADEGPAPPEPKTAEKAEKEAATDAPQQLYQTANLATAPEGPQAGLFAAGVEQYRNGRFQEAAESFRSALNSVPTNAKYAYYHAAALHQAGLEAEATDALAKAAALDRQSPVAQWGQTMQRIQGATRIWLEQGRKSL